jgi:uncharacterized Zn finger protein (UPF0148 family)
MKFRLRELKLEFRKSTEVIPFVSFNYFHGQMGAGKSSIARLIDFCLGGKLDLSPALQSEFISAALLAEINETQLSIERERGSNQCRVQWQIQGELIGLLIPCREANGVVLPNTEVENLSDLIFYLANTRPPRVRKSKVRDDSELVRLSFRDLFWYCYLDQDTIDSDFFNLDSSNFAVRLKSRDVLRFLIGFHQEEVAELEMTIEELRIKRAGLTESARALDTGLKEAELGSRSEIGNRMSQLANEITASSERISLERQKVEIQRQHAADQLRERARSITHEIASLEDAVQNTEEILSDDQRHLNELTILTVKIRRSAAAKAVLGAVDFEVCPRCAQSLPQRESIHCPVCGQEDIDTENNAEAEKEVREDIKIRREELEDIINRRREQLQEMRRRLNLFQAEKGRIDAELNTTLQVYDSAYLSSALLLERDKATSEQEMRELQRLKRLYDIVTTQLEQAASLIGQESTIKQKLQELRAEAERDTKSLRRLEELFLDCLVRAKVPGFSPNDFVEIKPSGFLPIVAESGMEEVVNSSFSNLSSGGKKTLFKACYAIAVHRLSAETGALLPTLLIIDSAMKNISERENREQFEDFHKMVYELAETELAETQFIFIDKEYFPPIKPDFVINVRYMRPNDKNNPPLIRYFQVNNLEDSPPETSEKPPEN